MTKSLYRPIATLVLLVLVLLQAGAVLVAHAYHADRSVAVVVDAEGATGGDASPEAGAASAWAFAMPSFDGLVLADCVEQCSGVAIPTARRDPPAAPGRWGRIPPPAIRFIAAPPERLERPPKSADVST